MFHTRAAKYDPGDSNKLSSTKAANHHENESRRHLEKAAKINKQAIELSEERKALLKKLESPPEYRPPTIPEKDLDDLPPDYKP